MKRKIHKLLENQLKDFAFGKEAFDRFLDEVNESYYNFEEEFSRQNKVNSDLRDVARQAGMAEIATAVLHNVGNVLNSANISLETILDNLDKASINGLDKANTLLSQNRNNLAEFFKNDPRGARLVDFYIGVGDLIKVEIQEQRVEATQLMKNLQLIKDIINTQQIYAKDSFAFRESISIADSIENALSVQMPSLLRHNVKVEKKYSIRPSIVIDKSKFIHIILNLIKNAKEAMADNDSSVGKLIIFEIGRTKRGDIFLKISDTGSGVQKDNLSRIFNHGFTTKKSGHGFGLHFCANSIIEMGAKISVASEGPGCGTTFSIEFDQKSEVKAA